MLLPKVAEQHVGQLVLGKYQLYLRQALKMRLFVACDKEGQCHWSRAAGGEPIPACTGLRV